MQPAPVVRYPPETGSFRCITEIPDFNCIGTVYNQGPSSFFTVPHFLAFPLQRHSLGLLLLLLLLIFSATVRLGK